MLERSRIPRMPIWPEKTAGRCAAGIQPGDLLPQTAPFVFVDRLIRLDKQEPRLLAAYQVAPHPFWTGGHFPDNPVFPGVLQIELMAQTALCLLRLLCPEEDAQPRLLGGRGSEFLALSRPDDILESSVQLVEDGLVRACHCQIHRDGELVAQAVLDVMG